MEDNYNFSEEFISYKKAYCMVKKPEKNKITLKIDELVNNHLTSPDRTREAEKVVKWLTEIKYINPDLTYQIDVINNTIKDFSSARRFTAEKTTENKQEVQFLKNFGQTTMKYIESIPYYCLKYYAEDEYHYAPVLNGIIMNEKFRDLLKLKLGQQDQCNGLKVMKLFHIKNWISFYSKYFTSRVCHYVSNIDNRIEEPDYILDPKEFHFTNTEGHVINTKILVYITKYFKDDCLYEKVYLAISSV